MLETPHIIQTTKILAATLHLVVPRVEIQQRMGPGIQEVMAAIQSHGLAPAGPWFTHHFRRPTDTFDFEICVPVATPIRAIGPVQPGEWPAMKVVRTVYQGPYEGLGEAWGEFLEWIEANGHHTAEELWERYLVGPESGPDGSAYRTELSRALV